MKDFSVFFGINLFLLKFFSKKLELNFYNEKKLKSFLFLSRKKKRVINILLAKIFNVNFNMERLIIFYILRKYVIRSWKGLRIFFNKPSKGQRTRSNASINIKFASLLRSKIKSLNNKNKNSTIDKKNYFINIKKKIKKKINFSTKKKSKINVLIKSTSWM